LNQKLFHLQKQFFLSYLFLFVHTLEVHGGGLLKRKTDILLKPDLSNIDTALAALNAEDLRDLICNFIPLLDDKTLSRFTNTIIERAAKGDSGWQPSGPTDECVFEALAFVKAAKRAGCADPSEVDDYLRQGSDAFLSRNYQAASLAADCVAVDKSSATSAWLTAIRNEFRRFPALQREFDRYLSQPRKKALK
jgi:hypothetical protein